MIKIVTLCGSARPGNYTGKALAVVNETFKTMGGVQCESIALGNLGLQVPGQGTVSDQVKRFQETVAAATGVVLATPEYHGSFSSLTKLAVENLGFPSALAGKPMALLGVAAGQIGAIKSLEHLRSVCSHVGAIVLPSLVSVADVQSVFDERGNCTDPKVEKRIQGVAVSLFEYIQGAVCPRVMLEAMVRDQDSA